MSTEKDFVVGIVLRAEARPGLPPPSVRVRRALKAMLRSYGIKATLFVLPTEMEKLGFRPAALDDAA